MGNFGGDRWPGGVVPFVINRTDFEISAIENTANDINNRISVDNILSAIEHWNSSTVIQIIPRKDHHVNFIEFAKHPDSAQGTGCATQLGFRDCGKHVVGCDMGVSVVSVETAIHEIGHVVGLVHEHQRHDRDPHVIVDLSIIGQRSLKDYEKSGTSVGNYDFNSVMHYGARFDGGFSARNAVKLGGNRHLSDGDRRTISHLYSSQFGGGNLRWNRHYNGKSIFDISARSGAVMGGIKIGSGWSVMKHIDATSSGVIYGLKHGTNQRLNWYRHFGYLRGQPAWSSNYQTPPFGKIVSNNFRNYKVVFGNTDGVVYAINNSGELFWYQDNQWKTGNFGFNAGVLVGTNWDRFSKVFAAYDGVIYGVNRISGELVWNKHLGWRTGANNWANSGVGKVISPSTPDPINWNRFKHIFTSNSGVIYAVENNGDLLWFRHGDVIGGNNTWTSPIIRIPADPVKLTPNLSRFTHIFGGVDGVIYALDRASRLNWYRHEEWTKGKDIWRQLEPHVIGHSWRSNVRNGEHVFSCGQVIYKTTRDGYLLWHEHHFPSSGASDWTSQSESDYKFALDLNPIGRVMYDTTHYGVSDNGVMYSIMSSGDLFWDKHLSYLTGQNLWANGVRIADDWADTKMLAVSGGGIIYQVTMNGELFWHKDEGYLHRDIPFNTNNGRLIARNWGNWRHIFASMYGELYTSDGVSLHYHKHDGWQNGDALDTDSVVIDQTWTHNVRAFATSDGIIYSQSGGPQTPFG